MKELYSELGFWGFYLLAFLIYRWCEVYVKIT